MKKRLKRAALVSVARLMRGLAVGGLLLRGAAFGAEAPPPPADAEADKTKVEAKADEKAASKDEEKKEESTTEYRNWFDVSVGGSIVDGDKAAYERRYGRPAGAFGGAEDFHYEQDVGKKGIFKVDGRSLFDNHDYMLQFDVEHPDVGFLRGGYKEFRSYYDGSGGYFRPTQQWSSSSDDALTLDRGEAWFEVGLTRPNQPNVTFRFDHQFRDGEKDSTAWGDWTVPGYGMRKIAPAFWGIDETRDIFQGDVKHTVGDTTLGLGLRYELSKNNDSRNVLIEPGATARYATDREKVNTDLFNVHAFSETRFNDKVLLTTGYSFTTLDSDLSGYRLYGNAYDPTMAQRLPVPDTFENLSGGSELKQHVANINLMFQLTDSLVLVPSLRIEKEETASESFYDSPAAPFSGASFAAVSDRGLLDVTEKLELRYTGLTNWVFYGRGEWMEGSGDLTERWDNVGAAANLLQRSTDDSRFWHTYTVGANWYPLRRLNFGAQYYHKERWTDYDHTTDSTINRVTSLPSSVYPAFLTARKWTTDDMNVRATWRPLANLTLVGRYDLQLSTIDTKPDRASGLSETQSADLTSHIIGGTMSWTPLARLYLQAGLNCVWDRTETPGSDAIDAIQSTRNDYWTANTSIGYALDNKTDLELQYLYYRADNLRDNSNAGLPYGADAREHGVTATVIRRITERMRVTLKYGFFDGSDRTSGNHNDYQAHLIYTSLHYRF